MKKVKIGKFATNDPVFHNGSPELGVGFVTRHCTFRDKVHVTVEFPQPASREEGCDKTPACTVEQDEDCFTKINVKALAALLDTD